MDIQKTQQQKKQKTQQQQKRKLDLLSSNKSFSFLNSDFNTYKEFEDFYKKILQYTDDKVSKITLKYPNANTFSQKEYLELFRLIEFNETIQELSIEGGSYHLDGLRTALSRTNKTLKKLSLSSPKSIKNLRRFIESCHRYPLQSLSLDDINLDLDVFEAISNISHEELTHLSLKSIAFWGRDREQVKKINILIKNNKYLQGLNLKDNNFRSDEVKMILNTLKRNDTLILLLFDEDYYRNEIYGELVKNIVLSDIVNYMNQKLPFPIRHSKFIFEKLLVFLDEYKDNLKQRVKLDKLDKQRMRKMLEVHKRIYELENYSPQTRKQIQDTKKQLKELQIEKEFLSYVPHHIEKISSLETRIQIERDRLMNKLLDSDEIRKKLNTMTTLREELQKILGVERGFYNQFTPRSVIKAELEHLTESDEHLKEIFKFRKLENQIRRKITRLEEQNKYIKEYNKPFQQFQKKNDPDTLKQFYINVVDRATLDPYYTTEKVDEIIGKYASQKELHNALLLFFQEFRKYNEDYVAEYNYSIDNFEYVMGVKVSQIIELNFLSPILLFFILEYIELYANDLYKEIPEKYKKGKRIFEPYGFSGRTLLILNHSEKILHHMNLTVFLLATKGEKDVHFPIFIMMMRLFKNKYIEIYDQISGYIYENFNVSFVDDKKDIEIDIMVLNSNIVPFSENQNVSLKIEWSKHSYLNYRMMNEYSSGILKRLSNLKQYFFFKFDELPIELKRFSNKILDKFYKLDEETAKFLFGKKTQQTNLMQKSSTRKRKLQQQDRSKDQKDMMKEQKTQQINQQGNKKLKTQYTQKAKTQKNTNHMQLQNRTQQLFKNYALEKSDPKILFDKSVNFYENVEKKEYTVKYPTSYQEKQSVTFTDLTQIKRILNKLVKQGYIINHFKQFERGGTMYKNVKVDEIEFTL